MNALVQTNTTSNSMALVPRSMDEAMRLAHIMSKANLMPDHLRGKEGDCLLVVMQAQRWGMDAISVAQCTSVVRGKLCYEGKLVAAALYAMGAVEGRIKYTYSGQGDDRKVIVSAVPRGQTEPVTVEGTVRQWATNNDNWKRSPDDMLAYRGARQWARRHAPEALLGVYTPDEMEEAQSVGDLPAVSVSQIEMPREKPAASSPAAESIQEGEIVGATERTSGTWAVTDSQKRLVLAKGKGAGMDEEAILRRFGNVTPDNINKVLSDLTALIEAAG